MAPSRSPQASDRDVRVSAIARDVFVCRTAPIVAATVKDIRNLSSGVGARHAATGLAAAPRFVVRQPIIIVEKRIPARTLRPEVYRS